MQIKHPLTGAVLREVPGDTLQGADLQYADLQGAGLRGADLRSADLRSANLRDAYLQGAYLRSADLRGANLQGADLRRADLYGANLRSADLHGANLRGADLRGADLRGVDLRGAKTDAHTRWPHFQICPPTGKFIAWKKLPGGIIAKIGIPRDAQRTSSLVGRKCRASRVKVLSLSSGTEAISRFDTAIVYRVGEYVTPDSYDPDPKVECTHGIHFFITREEAEEY